MELADFFGEGSQLVGGKVIIPRENLTAVGLSPSNDYPPAVLTAVFLRIFSYYQGFLLDSDGEQLWDSDGSPLAFYNPRSDSDFSFLFVRKALSSDESALYWRWLLTFYEVSETNLLE
ncbi:hypothetical protein [Synechocystis sp. CACIAM 05]|uniref:hypothetical protein n=1 Tax=Synechocystis sp. CACIAM 05 TaxID=1933929 RepID=UPI00138E8F9B|nr:hypothetical protein [Synechocystis sp. CACIAM 05]QHU99568.1 hypothetical protein BWK47_05115 [Synechocystis sp. CACIAM 05]